MPNIILLSERAQDIEFFNQVAKETGAGFITVNKIEDFLKVFATIPSSWVVWDADHPKNESPDHPYDLKSVRYILLKAVPHAQTFALTDVPIGLLPDHPKFSFLLNYPQHNLIRNYSQATSTFYSSIFKQFSKSDVSDFKNYFPKGAKFQEITLTESKHRIPAVDAIDSFFQKCSLAKRLAAKIAQATDELLMNALFDAPVENGNRIRHFLPRTAEFTVAKDKEVRLEAGIGDELCGICVTDRYGSVDKLRAVKSITQDFRKNEYNNKSSTYNSGIGLYSIVQAGISLIISYHPGVRTKAMIFFPNTQSYKKFRESFQAIAVVNQTEMNQSPRS